jgi:cellulose synthase/poly-beta-1,6-N-acetylglucosamine synthase-like glycosyltransferase
VDAVRRALLAGYLALTLAYLAWRAVWTLNPASMAWSVLFLALEAYAAWCSAVFYAVLLEAPRRIASPARPGTTVDVFVCTYNEPVSLVRQTLRRALAVDHPHRTFLLDDGNRTEARALAAELGCGYFARERNTDYKAGNLNHALARTSGELVVVLDADHLLRPHFLTRLLGYFDDPAVALVQTPQVFYNVDSFQHHFSARHRRLWHEGALFHHALQPGADRWNAAFFVGTGAVLRRSSLEAVGGFATGTVTEDCHTSLRLHAAGFRSVYHDEPLGYLQAPQSLLQYLTQRLRWGQGSMQILRRENPLTKPGLAPLQRLVYFNALSSFAQALVHLAYYLAPALFLLGAPAPLRVASPLQFGPLIAHFAVDLLMFRIFAGALARPLLCECYKFLNLFVYLRALSGLFARERLRFQVTTKGRDSTASRRLLLPHAALLLLNTTAFAAGCLRCMQAATAIDLLGCLVATGFAGLFVVVGGTATAFAWQRMAQTSEYAFADDIPATVAGVAARAVRINEHELQVVTPCSTRLPDRLPVRLEFEPPLQLECRVASVSEVRTRHTGDALLAHLRLDGVAQASVDRIYDRMVGEAMPRVVDAMLRGDAAAAEDIDRPPVLFLPVESNVL